MVRSSIGRKGLQQTRPVEEHVLRPPHFIVLAHSLTAVVLASAVFRELDAPQAQAPIGHPECVSLSAPSQPWAIDCILSRAGTKLL